MPPYADERTASKTLEYAGGARGFLVYAEVEMANKKTQPGKTLKKKTKGTQKVTTAFHAEVSDGHVVGIGNLRVMLFNDDGSWFAQGLEIDYFAQGETLGDVKENFECGLCATLSEHLKTNGTIEGILRIAPQEVWSEFFAAKPTLRTFSQLSFHAPLFSEYFAGIDYLEGKYAS